MKNTNSSGSNLVTNKVQINLDVLGALMLHRVGREINDIDVVVVKAMALATLQYLASALERETVFVALKTKIPNCHRGRHRNLM
jgi:hypothetical protein